MPGYAIVLIALAIFLIVLILIGISIIWILNRRNQKMLENLNPESYETISQFSTNLQEKLPILDTKVESVAQSLNSQANLLPKIDNKIDSLQQNTATEVSVTLLKENLIRLQELTHKLDKKTETLESKTDQNASLGQQQMNRVTDHLGKISTLDENIVTKLNVSMGQTQMIPTLDTKVEAIKRHTSDINAIKETLINLNQLVDGLNKATTNMSNQSNHHSEQNLHQLGEVQKELNDLRRIFINDRNRGRSGEIILENFLGNYFGAKGDTRLWSTQYKVTNINNPHQEIGLVDAVIFTPYQDQNIAIDAKFPALDYKKIFEEDGKINSLYKKEFEIKIKTKVKDLKKYIHPDNQIASVIMFIPSENIYYFIADQCPELMDYAYKENIWLAGPTILMAILSSQAQVIREHYFARDINKIKELIISLKSEFVRFDDRATKLKTVYDKYIKDTDNVFKNLQTTQNKITNKIEKLESFDEEISQDEPFIELPINSEAIMEV